MKAVIQRVSSASVVVDGAVVGSCEKGYLILLGVAAGDTETDAELLCKKIAGF
jgi:D-tyrosyl-tRNA(Tyr) deacylase